MKKIVSLCILCSFCIYASANYTQAIDTPFSIAETKVSEARLLEQYITRYIIRIRSLENQFPTIDSNYIEEILQNIEHILIELDNIQKGIYSISRTELILEWVIRYMKQINTELQNTTKNIQRQEREKLDRWIQRYQDSIIKIHNISARIIDIHSIYYLNQETLSTSDREAMRVIITLRRKNQELLAYNTKVYKNTEELQEYLRTLIQSIREDVIFLRKTRTKYQ